MAQRSPPRTRPVVQTLDADSIARLERGPGDGASAGAPDATSQDPAQSAEQPVAAATAVADGKAWRESLADVVAAGRLTALQEADCLRLFEDQEKQVREAIPRLLAELKPHFDTGEEAQAKLRFTEALQAMKRRQQDDLAGLLRSFGIESAPPTA